MAELSCLPFRTYLYIYKQSFDTCVLYTDTDCKCSIDTSPVATYCVAATAQAPSAVPAKPDRKRENSRSRPATTQLSFSPCLCRSHKM